MPNYHHIDEKAMTISPYNLYRSPNAKRPLSASFQPGPYDVICARGKQAYNHVGNKYFRDLVKLHQESYASATCKYQKSKIVSHIVDTVRGLSPNGGFVKLIKGVWYETGDRAAKEKVGQTFRDILHTKYSSSTKAKARARIQQRIEQYGTEIIPSLKPVHVSSQESSDPSESTAADDEGSIERGLYPSFVDTRRLPPRNEVVNANQINEAPENLLFDSIRAFESSIELPELQPSMQLPNIEPLSLKDDKLGSIGSFAETSLTRHASSSFDDDLKDFCRIMSL